MKTPTLRYTLFLLAGILLLAGGVVQVRAQNAPLPLRFEQDWDTGPVFVVPVEGMIDNGLATYIERALSDAEGADARLVVFHIDTFGGLLDAADEIRKDILNTPIPTVAFIDKNAASAGALISYAADRIVMVPGATIGAATVVEGVGGEAAPDKYQSYMRGLMRATAEENERDPRIAEAMVDETIEVEGISEGGKVLTLTAAEALKHGVADAIINTVDALLEAFSLGDVQVVAHQATRAEQVLRFLSSPALQSILMLMMLGGLYFELQTPGLGLAGTVALVGAALFFAPHYLLGLAASWEIVLFVIGVLLILAEIFIIPGFGVAGISGIILVVGSLFAALIGNIQFSFPPITFLQPAILTMAFTLVLLVVFMFSLSRYLPRSNRFGQLVLAPELSSMTGYTSADTRSELEGRTGKALTALRPAGTAEIGDERIDVISAGEFIDAGQAVRVVNVRGSRVEVRAIPTLSSEAETSNV